MMKNGSECVQQAQSFTKEIESFLVANGTERADIIKILNATSNAKNGDVLFYLADKFAITVQYGNRTGLCNVLQEI